MLPPSPAVSALDAIGNTPVVQLQRITPPGSAAVFVKIEGFNPTGSYTDRMALAMIEEAEERGALTHDLTVIEHTGGSTGSSLAFVDETKARAMCRVLAEQEGLHVGTSSGLNVAAALDLARELGPGKVVVTVARDTGLKYLDGDLFAERHR